MVGVNTLCDFFDNLRSEWCSSSSNWRCCMDIDRALFEGKDCKRIKFPKARPSMEPQKGETPSGQPEQQAPQNWAIPNPLDGFPGLPGSAGDSIWGHQNPWRDLFHLANKPNGRWARIQGKSRSQGRISPKGWRTGSLHGHGKKSSHACYKYAHVIILVGIGGVESRTTKLEGKGGNQIYDLTQLHS